MNSGNYNHIALSLVVSVVLLLGSLVLLNGASSVARADPGVLFAKPDRSGIACTQGQPCTLQNALAQATDGDAIYTAQGTYTGKGDNVIEVRKSITLYGGWDGSPTGPLVRDPAAHPTTLDGEHARRVVFIGTNVTPTLDGLRLTNGSTSGNGGGIYANRAHPTVTGCSIFSNTANFSGGGVLFNNSPNTTLTDNAIYSNTAKTYTGGGVYLRNSANATMMRNSVYDNIAGAEGGGVYVVNSDDVTLASNTLLTNTSIAYGGGIFFGGSNNVELANNQLVSNTASQGGGVYFNNSPNATLTDNSIYSNTAEHSGGGVSLYNDCDGAMLTRNVVSNNATGGSGGGIYLYAGTNATLINNMVVENQLTGIGTGGAGIYAYDADAELLHTTIARNSGGSGQGIHLENGATVWMTNTVLVSHTVGIEAGAGTTATLEATLWGAGVWANIDNTAGGGTIFTGTVNAQGDPVFIGPAGGDYHIGPGSAALDAGIGADVTTDVDVEPRPYQDPDLGADEYWPPGALTRIYLAIVQR